MLFCNYVNFIYCNKFKQLLIMSVNYFNAHLSYCQSYCDIGSVNNSFQLLRNLQLDWSLPLLYPQTIVRGILWFCIPTPPHRFRCEQDNSKTCEGIFFKFGMWTWNRSLYVKSALYVNSVHKIPSIWIFCFMTLQPRIITRLS